jgi:hypothetical protein
MVKLNTASMKYAGREDVTLTLAEIPGFALEVPAGSVTFPDGAREGYLSVTPNGMQPQFIVTIQPTGAMFDPPAKLTLPNVDGYAPGRQVEMFSYDHDLEEFVAIGLGTVSKDGKIVTSNPGVGVVKAGWHCGAQAGGSGTSHDCPTCYKCEDATCVEDPAQVNVPLEKQIPKNCKTETCGGSLPDPNDKPEDKPDDCVDPTCDGSEKYDNSEVPPEDCIICKEGKVRDRSHKLRRTQLPDDCEDLYCDNKDEPALDEPVKQDLQTKGDCATLKCDDTKDYNGGDKPEEVLEACRTNVWKCLAIDYSVEDWENLPNGAIPQAGAHKDDACYECEKGAERKKLDIDIPIPSIEINVDTDTAIRALSRVFPVYFSINTKVSLDGKLKVCCEEDTVGVRGEVSASRSDEFELKARLFPAAGTGEIPVGWTLLSPQGKKVYSTAVLRGEISAVGTISLGINGSLEYISCAKNPNGKCMNIDVTGGGSIGGKGELGLFVCDPERPGVDCSLVDGITGEIKTGLSARFGVEGCDVTGFDRRGCAKYDGFTGSVSFKIDAAKYWGSGWEDYEVSVVIVDFTKFISPTYTQSRILDETPSGECGM